MRYRFWHCANVIGAGIWNQLDEIEPLGTVVTANRCHHAFHSLNRRICNFCSINKQTASDSIIKKQKSKNRVERNPSTKVIVGMIQLVKLWGKKNKRQKNGDYFLGDVKHSDRNSKRERERPWDRRGSWKCSSASMTLLFRVQSDDTRKRLAVNTNWIFEIKIKTKGGHFIIWIIYVFIFFYKCVYFYFLFTFLNLYLTFIKQVIFHIIF